MRYSLLALIFFQSQMLQAFTANKVGWKTKQNGLITLVIEYTIPDLKEKRLAEIDYASQKKASEVYGKLVQGADFYFKDAGKIVFQNPEPKPSPW